MSDRSTAVRLLVPLAVLGLFAATVGAAVTSVTPNHDTRREQARPEAAHAAARRVRSQVGAPPEAPAPGYAGTSIHGVVQYVDGKLNVYVISVGSKDDVRPGMEFEVRRGDERLGTLIVDGVFENYVTAKRRPGTRAFAAEPGDNCTTGSSPR